MSQHVRVMLVVCALHASVVAQPSTEVAPPAPPRVIVGAGVGLFGGITAGEDAIFYDAGYYVEALYRPSKLPIYAFASYDYSGWTEDIGGPSGAGKLWHLRAGAEARWCSGGGHACGFVDAAIGVAQATLDANYMTLPGVTFPQTALAFSGRVGFDLGSRNVRFRVALDGVALTRTFVDRYTCNGDPKCGGSGTWGPTMTYTADLGTPSGFELGVVVAF